MRSRFEVVTVKRQWSCLSEFVSSLGRVRNYFLDLDFWSLKRLPFLMKWRNLPRGCKDREKPCCINNCHHLSLPFTWQHLLGGSLGSPMAWARVHQLSQLQNRFYCLLLVSWGVFGLGVGFFLVLWFFPFHRSGISLSRMLSAHHNLHI